MNIYNILNSFVIAIFILPIFVFTTMCNQDTLYLKNGSLVVGKIVNFEEGKEYEILTEDGDRILILQEQIHKVDLTRFIRPTIIPLEYEFGFTFGMPAIGNFVFSKHFGVHAIKASGYYYDSGTNGLQLEYSIKFAQFPNTYHAINTIIGTFNWRFLTTDIDGSKYLSYDYADYFGIAYNINFYGFYLQAGIGYSETLKRGSMPLGQIGYVYQFR